MASSRPVDLAYVPTVACFSRATVPLGVDLDRLIAALQVYVDDYVAPVWGTPAHLVRSSGYLKGGWAIIFADDADQPGFTAHHDRTPAGLPRSHVFVRTCVRDDVPLTRAASHELVEMLVDPGLNLLARDADNVMHLYEAADPVDDDQFPIDGLPMSNFVYPAYFESFHARDSVRFDHMKLVRDPFEIRPGGYQTFWTGTDWDHRYGSEVTADRHRTQDRRGRRGAHRTRTRTPRPDKD